MYVWCMAHWAEQLNEALQHVFETLIYYTELFVWGYILHFFTTSLDNKNYKLYTYKKANGSFYLLIWGQTTGKLSLSRNINKT